MTTEPREPELEERRLDQLIPFPLQQLYFGDTTGGEFAALVASIESKGGLDYPIEVLPANRAGFSVDTILKGHQRCRALRQLAWETDEVIVRYDLEAATADEIEAEFLEDNRYRRHEDILGRARASKRLLALGKGKQGTDLRDLVGEEVGLSGRHLQRLWHILETPIEVQRAVSAGILTQQMAGAVHALEKAVQAEIAARIQAGEAARAVVKEYLPERPKQLSTALSQLIRGLSANIPTLRGQEQGFVGTHSWQRDLPLLEESREVLGHLIVAITTEAQKDRTIGQQQSLAAAASNIKPTKTASAVGV